MNFSEDQILALAPDESSKKAGKDLANARKWVSRGANEQAVWGECQGSGSKPYQTQTDLSTLSFKCSCPSRKFPCKHGLGLMLQYARNPQEFAITEPPAWVSDWLDKRAQREEKKEEKKDKPVDAAAQAKRLEARENKVSGGIDELMLWLKDIVRNGILHIPEKGYTFWDNMAKRMVDAQAGGLANMIKALGELSFHEEGWQQVFLDGLCKIYVVAQAYKNSGEIPGMIVQDIRSLAGFNTSLDELKQQAGITDTWLVIAKEVTEEELLTVERNWLYGTKTATYALVMQFFVRGQGVAQVYTPGMLLTAEVVFYPSVAPLRAIVKQQLDPQPAAALKAFTGWQEVAEAETGLYEKLPLPNQRPYIIKNITAIKKDQQWMLADAHNHMVTMKANHDRLYKLLAVSGGAPLHMAVLGAENEFEALGVWQQNNYVIL